MIYFIFPMDFNNYSERAPTYSDGDFFVQQVYSSSSNTNHKSNLLESQVIAQLEILRTKYDPRPFIDPNFESPVTYKMFRVFTTKDVKCGDVLTYVPPHFVKCDNKIYLGPDFGLSMDNFEDDDKYYSELQTDENVSIHSCNSETTNSTFLGHLIRDPGYATYYRNEYKTVRKYTNCKYESSECGYHLSVVATQDIKCNEELLISVGYENIRFKRVHFMVTMLSRMSPSNIPQYVEYVKGHVVATRDIPKQTIITLWPKHIICFEDIDSEYRTCEINDSKIQKLYGHNYKIKLQEKHGVQLFRQTVGLIGDPFITDNYMYLGHVINDNYFHQCDKANCFSYPMFLGKPVMFPFAMSIISSKDIQKGDELFSGLFPENNSENLLDIVYYGKGI
jgi:hypothetical protein